MRGHDCLNSLPVLRRGSSPRMRGTQFEVAGVEVPAGIIPAYAGNTDERVRREYSHRDHPRVCGEHGRIVTINGNVKGSSPRMRGTRWSLSAVPCIPGIIPAYAGNTRIQPRMEFGVRDHPRVCGEHVTGGLTDAFNLGSSPRMRGTHRIQSRRCDLPGIIPAYAGNTFRHGGIFPSGWDHPRVCGEHRGSRPALER